MTNTIHYTHICLCVSVWLHKDTSATKADFCYVVARTTSPKQIAAISLIILPFFLSQIIIMWHVGYFQSHCTFSPAVPSPHIDLISPSWQTEPSKPIWACSASAKVGGCGGVMALLRQKKKNQTHCSISLPLAPSFCLLKFWCWMVTHCEIASCLGGLCGARSGSYIWPSLDSDFQAMYTFGREYVEHGMDALHLLQRIHFEHDWIDVWL